MSGGATCPTTTALQYTGDDEYLSLYSSHYNSRYHGDKLAPTSCNDLQNEAGLLASADIKYIYLQKEVGSPMIK